jgi:hypothetical protein
MRFIGVAILVLAAVIGVVGWRLTEHHAKPCPTTGYAALTCELNKK